MRATTDTSMPPNLLRHLENVAELMPYSRHNSGTRRTGLGPLEHGDDMAGGKAGLLHEPPREG